MKLALTLAAALATFTVGSPARADDMAKPDAPGRPAPAPAPTKPMMPDGRPSVGGTGVGMTGVGRTGGMIEITQVVARFHVDRDVATGRMTFRLDDPSLKLDGAPAVILTANASGPKEVALAPVAGQPGTWGWSDDLVKAERLDGQLRVVIDGRTYLSALASAWTGESISEDDGGADPWKARFGGQVVALMDCGIAIEVEMNPATGMLKLYSFEGALLTEPPVLVITAAEGPTTVTMMRVEGQNGGWWAKQESFKAAATSVRLRTMIGGKACEAPLLYATGRGGQIAMVAGGPSFEVVREKDGAYTFYAVDEMVGGRPYTVEKPTFLWNGRTMEMAPVEGQARAWRLMGMDGGNATNEGQLHFGMSGKPMSVRMWLRRSAMGRMSGNGATAPVPGKGLQNDGTGTQGSGAK